MSNTGSQPSLISITGKTALRERELKAQQDSIVNASGGHAGVNKISHSNAMGSSFGAKANSLQINRDQ